MEGLQRVIEDERKVRVANIFPPTGAGSLGRGITTCWSGWPAADTEIRVRELSRRRYVDALGAARGPSHTGFDILMPDVTRSREPGSNVANWKQRRRRGSSTTVSRSQARGFRERELEWRRTNRATLRQFQNEWVVLEGEDVISHSPDAAQAIRQAKSQGIRMPYIFFVEPESDDFVRIGL